MHISVEQEETIFCWWREEINFLTEAKRCFFSLKRNSDKFIVPLHYFESLQISLKFETVRINKKIKMHFVVFIFF